MVARVRQEDGLYWVARPRCLPEPPLEDADGARLRAELLALWNLPSQWAPQKKIRRHDRPASAAMIQRDDVPVNVSGGYRFPSARQIDLAPLAPSPSVQPRIRLVHDRARFAQAVPSRWRPAGKGDDVPDVPAFLDRRRRRRFETVAHDSRRNKKDASARPAQYRRRPNRSGHTKKHAA
jgi:hypothetical protein